MKQSTVLVLSLIVFGTLKVKGAVFKLDVTLFDKYPLVESQSSEQIRAYVDWNSEDSTAYHQIGRTGYTGTGEKGTGFDPPEETGPASDVPSDAGFPSGTKTKVKRSYESHKRLEVNFEESTSSERVGVFYTVTGLIESEINYNLTISIVKLSKEATIKPTRYTETSAIGSSVTLRVTTILTNQDSLRWMHNNGPIIEEWNGRTDVTIDNVRFADAGIYECYEEGRRENGEHSIMILIVRGCPHSKYGKDCSQNCQTCWNGGICEAETGVCVCPPGFKGVSCETPCGDSNHFGASCSIYCAGGLQDCKERVICPPDPIGCTCVTGFAGLSCNQGCLPGKYGANCERYCHCSDDECDPANGCNSTANCDSGYGGITCQVPDKPCPYGYFGELCNIKCHCDKDVDCNENGVCSNYRCAPGWAGSDCQQALPVFAVSPSLDEINVLSFTITWDEWDRNCDYGVGQVNDSVYKVHCLDKKTNSSTVSESTSELVTTISLPNFETDYECGVSIIKAIEGELVDGPPGPRTIGTTQCGPPSSSPTFTNDTDAGHDYVYLKWTVPEDDDWIECSDGLRGFTLSYTLNDPDNSLRQTQQINIIDPDRRNYKVMFLSPCANYAFYISARNKYSSGPTDSLNVITDSVPPERPINLNVTPESSSALRASWLEPSHECGLTDYIIIYELTNYDHCDESIKHPNKYLRTDGTSVTIMSLESFSIYNISVAATLEHLNSAFTNDSGATGVAIPAEAPTALNSDSSKKGKLIFSWEPPACGQRNGPISKYEYQFAEMLNGSDYEGCFTDSLLVIVDELKDDTYYEFRIAAHSPKGRGPYSEVLRTKPDTCSQTNAITIVAGVSLACNAIFIILLVIVISRKLSNLKKEPSKTKSKEPEPTQLDTHTYTDLIKKNNEEPQYMGIYNDVTRNDDITDNITGQPTKKSTNPDYANMDSNI